MGICVAKILLKMDLPELGVWCTFWQNVRLLTEITTMSLEVFFQIR